MEWSFYLWEELVILLSLEKACIPCQQDRWSKGPGNSQGLQSQSRGRCTPQTARQCVQFWSPYWCWKQVPRKPHRWPRIKKKLGDLKVLHLKKRKSKKVYLFIYEEKEFLIEKMTTSSFVSTEDRIRGNGSVTAEWDLIRGLGVGMMVQERHRYQENMEVLLWRTSEDKIPVSV